MIVGEAVHIWVHVLSAQICCEPEMASKSYSLKKKNSIVIQQQQFNHKMGKKHEQTFHQKADKWQKKKLPCEKIFNIIDFQENANESDYKLIRIAKVRT